MYQTLVLGDGKYLSSSKWMLVDIVLQSRDKALHRRSLLAECPEKGLHVPESLDVLHHLEVDTHVVRAKVYIGILVRLYGILTIIMQTIEIVLEKSIKIQLLDILGLEFLQHRDTFVLSHILPPLGLQLDASGLLLLLSMYPRGMIDAYDIVRGGHTNKLLDKLWDSGLLDRYNLEASPSKPSV